MNPEANRWKLLLVNLLVDLSICEDIEDVWDDMVFHARQAGLLTDAEWRRAQTREELGKVLDAKYQNGLLEPESTE